MQVIMAMTDPLDGAGDGSPEVLPICDDARAQLGTSGLAGRAMHQAAAAGRRGTSIAGNLSASLRSVLTDVGKVTDVVSFTRSDAAMLAKLGSGLTADRNLLQGQLAGAKQRSWIRPVPVTAVKAAGRGSGATVNDVVLTAITSALRRYLLEHDALVTNVLVIEPVNLRAPGAALSAGLGNKFGLVFIVLPTGEPDPARRRVLIRAQMEQIKHGRESALAYTMLELMGQIPAGLQNCLYRRVRGPGYGDRFGRRRARGTGYSSPGRPSRASSTWVPATGPVGLGFSAVSYAGQLTVGIASNAGLVPDHDRLVALIDAEISALARPDCRVPC